MSDNDFASVRLELSGLDCFFRLFSCHPNVIRRARADQNDVPTLMAGFQRESPAVESENPCDGSRIPVIEAAHFIWQDNARWFVQYHDEGCEIRRAYFFEREAIDFLRSRLQRIRETRQAAIAGEPSSN